MIRDNVFRRPAEVCVTRRQARLLVGIVLGFLATTGDLRAQAAGRDRGGPPAPRSTPGFGDAAALRELVQFEDAGFGPSEMRRLQRTFGWVFLVMLIIAGGVALIVAVAIAADRRPRRSHGPASILDGLPPPPAQRDAARFGRRPSRP